MRESRRAEVVDDRLGEVAGVAEQEAREQRALGLGTAWWPASTRARMRVRDDGAAVTRAARPR